MSGYRKRTHKSARTKTVKKIHSPRTTTYSRKPRASTKRKTRRRSPVKLPSSPSRLFTFFDLIVALPPLFHSVKNNIRYLSRSRKIGLLFLLLGILLISFPYLTRFFIQVGEEEIPIKADATFASSPTVEKSPIRILIPSLQIDLPINPSKLVNGYWQVSEKSASYGLGSAPPGSIGNTVIFAHAREGLFLPLKNITFGKDIYVLSPDIWYQYRVDEIREVLPTDVYVVKKTSDNRLTLFTCSGFLDSKRLVVIAKPVK